ncbi:ATP-binding cassette domain-containing protein [Mesorhizobium tamadayense]|uniref:ATP-binding cassette domain-containing protein n=1 Tax=Mesorhizobium tamadayense TaxID=425306 RepID=A0A3P3FSV1_9HYPH|nr:ATP-binding cassette domain-containing protein [Mesorhizobium tamadayense]RRI01705.1 ATP-binding cassette domain-containing protein [Mesorhizobium tamadayense]
MSSPEILSVSRVEAVYNGAIAALHGVDLAVGKGEIVALLGSNGAGKTTLLRAVSNLLPAERGTVTAGRISFDGEDVSRASPSHLVRKGLVQVLEGRHCFRSLTVEENLLTGALGRSSSRNGVKADLERVYALFPRLLEKRRTRSGLTSGGEQQMTAIGRGLMSRPKLLYGDGQLQTGITSTLSCTSGAIRRSPFDESVCVTRFANEPSPPYIRSGRMHLFHDPACGGFGPKRRNHSSAAAV